MLVAESMWALIVDAGSSFQASTSRITDSASISAFAAPSLPCHIAPSLGARRVLLIEIYELLFVLGEDLFGTPCIVAADRKHLKYAPFS